MKNILEQALLPLAAFAFVASQCLPPAHGASQVSVSWTAWTASKRALLDKIPCPQAQGVVAFDTPSALAVDVFTFGATPNDGLDDRVAIQDALNAACDLASSSGQRVDVLFDAGVYLVSKGPEPPPFEPWVLLELRCGNITLRGERDTSPNAGPGGLSVLKVMDSTGDYEALLAGRLFQTDVDGLRIFDLTFDGNAPANPVLQGDATFSDVFKTRRYAIRSYWGDDLRIERCRFTRWATVNVVVANGIKVADFTIRNCVFDEIGTSSTAAPDWDHSSIYTDCDGATIEGNVFASLGVGSFGARTAIETHGPRQRVSCNYVYGFTTGLNVTGVSALGSDLQIVSNNVFEGVSDGIRIWAFTVNGNQPGTPVLKNCTIRDNDIVIDVDGWRPTQDAFSQAAKGIELFATSDGDIENLLIQGNSIRFTNFGSQPRAYDQDASGIRMTPFGSPVTSIKGLVLRDNYVERSLATGIYLGSPLVDGALIEGNRLIDCGQGPPSVPNALRTGLILFGDYGPMTLVRNCFVDTGPTPKLVQAVTIFGLNGQRNSLTQSGLVIASGANVPLVTFEGSQGQEWAVQPPVPRCP